jgi:predicted glutamine amidotransferase
LGGNFHKFLTNKKGEVVAFFHNGTLLDDAYNNGEKTVYSSEVEMENMKKLIAEIIETDYTNNEWYKHEPNKKIFPK